MRYGDFDVYIDESAAGTLKILKSGLLTCFECTAKADTDSVLRLAADVGGRYEVIGVMMPEDGALHLKKYFTKNDLYIKNLSDAKRYLLIEHDAEYKPAEILRDDTPEEPVTACEAPVMQEADAPVQDEGSSLWQPCAYPEKLFNDAEAGAAIAGCSGVITSEKDGFTFVAVPVDPGRPFPAMPVFFFGTQGRINDNDYLVFRLKDGQIQV